jgi:hypothetical protein
MQLVHIRTAACLILALLAGAAFAEEKHEQAPAHKSGQAAPKQKQQMSMNTTELTLLIKSPIIALQQANQTGNYSVLRDMGSPVFRERFDQTKLAAIFANLRSRNVNLTPVMIITPNLTKQPEMTEQNQLHLVGDFPAQPLKVQFELLFLSIDGIWRIEGIAVDAVPAGNAAQASAAPAPAPPGPAKPAKKK